MTLTTIRTLAVSVCVSVIGLTAWQPSVSAEPVADDKTAKSAAAIEIQYLEIVTTELDATCATLSIIHGVTFGAPDPGFGNARIAQLSDGGRIGVRSPLSPDEGAPVVRPYLRVENIETAIAAAEASGAEFAMRATEIPGHGKFAIYFQGGVQYGLWEL